VKGEFIPSDGSAPIDLGEVTIELQPYQLDILDPDRARRRAWEEREAQGWHELRSIGNRKSQIDNSSA
jgi:hypothetical protein